jgi:quinolinate synthase
MLWQPQLPDRYMKMTEAQLAEAIWARKAELGSKLVILGHHYQQDEVIQFADFTGDSFKLSQLAADQVKKTGAKYVIFQGVHFMAESADILAPEGVQVILPDMSAGCSMADMAEYEDTVGAWNDVAEACRGMNVRVVPVCYMNSSAAIKSFVGEHGGAVCTSSNADKILKWALAGGDTALSAGETVKIIFIPDQHLGRNTAVALGYDTERDMVVWNPKAPEGMGGNSVEDVRRATFLLWKGHCSVHKLFRPEHVQQARDQWPDVTVMVHPECAHEVVQRADLSGSTEGIIKAIETAKPGSKWAVGTEVHLVNRLAKAAAKRGVQVKMLSDCQCLCTTMYRIDMPHMLWIMDALVQGKVLNQIKVHPTVKQWSLVSLNRMLKVTADANKAVLTAVEPPAVKA